LELLKRALTIFPDQNAPRDRAKRCEILFKFEEENPKFFDELDQIWYREVDRLSKDSKENIAQLLIEHMTRHADTRLLK
jgi:hypothetical protein